jgi:hypothetical protein
MLVRLKRPSDGFKTPAFETKYRNGEASLTEIYQVGPRSESTYCVNSGRLAGCFVYKEETVLAHRTMLLIKGKEKSTPKEA